MITVRQSTLDDAEAISACIATVARERRYLATTQGFNVDETRKFIAWLEKNGGTQIIAVDDGSVVGWCDASPFSFEGMRHVRRIGIGLLEPYRGQGWGGKLLREVLRATFQEDTTISRVELDVFASNRAAIKLYEKNGFVIEGRQRRGWILDGIQDDRLLMGLLREDWTFDVE